jgi:hypothetical protein
MVRRFIYFVVMLITGSGAGLGGWALKDHPILQALLGRVLPKTEDGSIDREKLASVVTEALKRDDCKTPGLYRVKVAEVRLDQKLFKQGHTVDIQARIRQRDASGKEATIWESRPYGENLGQVGRDELTATWINRPFEVNWAAGDRIFVEIWDRKAGLFDRKELQMATPEAEVFPLASGAHPLSLAGAELDPARSRIVFDSQRIGDLETAAGQKTRREDPREVAERPIVIK